jgi:hypothetical protein
MFLELHEGAIDCVKTRDSRFPGISHQNVGERELRILPYVVDETGTFRLDQDSVTTVGCVHVGWSAPTLFKALLEGKPFAFPEKDGVICMCALLAGEDDIPMELHKCLFEEPS